MAKLNTIVEGIRQARITLPLKGGTGYETDITAAQRQTTDFPRMADNQRQTCTCIRVRAKGLAFMGLSSSP